MNQYPSWRYHATLPAVIVTSPEDEARRANPFEGWADSPDRTVVAPLPTAGAFAVEPDPIAVALDPPIVPKRRYGPYKRRETGV